MTPDDPLSKSLADDLRGAAVDVLNMRAIQRQLVGLAGDISDEIKRLSERVENLTLERDELRAKLKPRSMRQELGWIDATGEEWELQP